MASPPAPWTPAAVREALGLPADSGTSRVAPPEHFPRICTDTRRLEAGDLFVAIRGPNFDGHDFLSEAAARGAGGAVVHRSAPAEDLLPLFPVDDTLRALGALALHRRRTLTATVVAITGSSGKTTVKELLRAALTTTFRTHATRGNLNNRIGLPLTLLETPADTEVLVAELGTNEPGEIETLARITEPEIAIVTTVGESHVERLGSLEGVLREKLSLLNVLMEEGHAIVGDEPAILPREALARRPERTTITGLSPRADEAWRAERTGADAEGRWTLRLASFDFTAPLPGGHGARNTLLALAGAERLGVTRDDAMRGFQKVELPALRGEIRRIGGLELILDCYNANPQSTRAALERLADHPAAGRRVAVLGSMLELGNRSPALHEALLDEAMKSGFDMVVAVGDFARAAEGTGREGIRGEEPLLLVAVDAHEAFERLRPHLGGDEVILLKASRGVALEQMLPHFEESFGSEEAD